MKKIKEVITAGFNSGNRDLQFQISLVDDEMKLLQYQNELEKQVHTDIFLDTSTVDTVYNMVFMGNVKAVKVKNDFKMTDATYIYIIIFCIVFGILK